MDSSMQANGRAHRPPSSAPSRWGAPAPAANAMPGSMAMTAATKAIAAFWI